MLLRGEWTELNQPPPLPPGSISGVHLRWNISKIQQIPVGGWALKLKCEIFTIDLFLLMFCQSLSLSHFHFYEQHFSVIWFCSTFSSFLLFWSWCKHLSSSFIQKISPFLLFLSFSFPFFIDYFIDSQCCDYSVSSQSIPTCPRLYPSQPTTRHHFPSLFPFRLSHHCAETFDQTTKNQQNFFSEQNSTRRGSVQLSNVIWIKNKVVSQRSNFW